MWDFMADAVLGQIFDWIYGKLVGFFSEFFEMMNMMGAELFDLPWTQAVVLFFSRFAWMLFAVGLVVAGFEYAIQSQSGRGDLHGLALNGIKGFMAVSLFTTVPVELYRLCVTLQGTFASGLTQLMGGENGSIGSLTRAAMGALNGYGAFVGLFLLILLGYAVFKVFFANLRRGGILLIQIAVGSLYFFSVPRGYLDGFWNWGKQVAGLCLTAFADDDAHCRPDGVEYEYAAGLRDDAGKYGSSADRGRVRCGHQHARQRDGRGPYGTVRHQYCADGLFRTGLRMHRAKAQAGCRRSPSAAVCRDGACMGQPEIETFPIEVTRLRGG